MQDILDPHENVKVEAGNTKVDSAIEGVMSVEEVAKSRLRGKMKELQRMFEHGGKAVPTFAVKIIWLSGNVVGAKHGNANLQNCDSLVKGLHDCGAQGCLARDRLERVEGRANVMWRIQPQRTRIMWTKVRRMKRGFVFK